jgi:hypothetical protein
MEQRLLGASILALALGVSRESEARPRFAIFAGAQCDAPAVEDGQSFDSGCSMAPLAGFAAGFRPPGPLGLEALASYARRSFTSPAFVTDTAVRVDFLEVALEGTLVIHSSPGGFRVTALGGPELGVVLRARRLFRDVDQDIANELRQADFRLVALLRLSRHASAVEVFVESGVAWGLTNLDDTNQQTIHSRAFLIRLGVAR